MIGTSYDKQLWKALAESSSIADILVTSYSLAKDPSSLGAIVGVGLLHGTQGTVGHSCWQSFVTQPYTLPSCKSWARGN